MDRIESASHCTVFTAFAASIASLRERSMTSLKPSSCASVGSSAGGGTGTGAFATTSKSTLAVTVGFHFPYLPLIPMLSTFANGVTSISPERNVRMKPTIARILLCTSIFIGCENDDQVGPDTTPALPASVSAIIGAVGCVEREAQHAIRYVVVKGIVHTG